MYRELYSKVEYDDCYYLVLSEVYNGVNKSTTSCKTILNPDTSKARADLIPSFPPTTIRAIDTTESPHPISLMCKCNLEVSSYSLPKYKGTVTLSTLPSLPHLLHHSFLFK